MPVKVRPISDLGAHHEIRPGIHYVSRAVKTYLQCTIKQVINVCEASYFATKNKKNSPPITPNLPVLLVIVFVNVFVIVFF